ncbi:TetR/AcrR family transcriptional regulator [Litorivivens sp.]|uniref:TetR/AcrR family transcriptional regulator n=1 Tax=Litorivivens sp. TaxID=2020868 RepID=UPI003569EEF3
MSTKTYRPHFASASDARVLRTREALRAAMLELLESQPLEQITIPLLAARAGIGRTTFFRHYPSKDALLDDVATDAIRDLIELTLQGANGNDAELGPLLLCRYVAKHRQLWKALLTGGAAGAVRDEFVRVAREVAAKAPTRSSWVPNEASIVIISSSTIALLTWWLEQDRPISAKRVASIMEQTILAPHFA